MACSCADRLCSTVCHRHRRRCRRNLVEVCRLCLWWRCIVGRRCARWGTGVVCWCSDRLFSTAYVSRVFGRRLRLATKCVDWLFSTACLPESQGTSDAIVISIFFECVCFSIPCNTAVAQKHLQPICAIRLCSAVCCRTRLCSAGCCTSGICHRTEFVCVCCRAREAA